MAPMLLRPQHLANMAWACAKLQLANARVREEMPGASAWPLSLEFHAQHIASTAWSYAVLHVPTGPVWHASAGYSMTEMYAFNAQDLVNTAWAFEALGCINAAILGGATAIATCGAQGFELGLLAVLADLDSAPRPTLWQRMRATLVSIRSAMGNVPIASVGAR
eukprot:NODE_9375_length_1428_cov_5.249039.p1 GENE.NODE_9375_length_1428_cov_5.249039~~NODE_9375_length_1428_cov_5.249039.p1  ORF type:complete len:164 (+),score=12.36 NODE_9375_length_1428_cov_5.249039:916-1407(+)